MLQFSPADHALMQQAIALAWQGRFSTSPNPRVGCVIAQGGQIVGQGFHLKAGEPHAEVHALRQAGAVGGGKCNIETATALMTLAAGNCWTAEQLQQALEQLDLA